MLLTYILIYDKIFQEIWKNKTQLDFEPKTSHDFVTNLELLDLMEIKIAEIR